MPASERPVRIGIVGAGWVAGARHVPSYRLHPRAQLVAVCDRRLEKARAFARRHRIAQATDSLEHLLSLNLDLVDVSTPPFAHVAIATQALGAGANVLLEKPMAMTLAEAQQIATAAEAAGRSLCVMQNFLFCRSMRRLRAVLDSGEAGPIQFAMGFQASSTRRRLPAWYGDLPAGLFFDETPHLLYLLTSLLGPLSVAHVSAVRNSPENVQPIRSLHAVFTSGAAPATLTVAFESPVSEWYLLVLCEQRVLLLDLFRDTSVVLGSDRSHAALDILRTAASGTAQELIGVASSGSRIALGRQFWGTDRLIHAVLDALVTAAPPPVPISQSLDVVRVTDDILRAIA